MPLAAPEPRLAADVRPPWLAELAGAPLPNRREEAWRFTDLALLRDLAEGLLPSPDPLASQEFPAGVSQIGRAHV